MLEAMYKSLDLGSGCRKVSIYELADIVYGAPFASRLFNTDKIGKPIIRIRDLKSQQLVTYTTENHPKGYLLQSGDIVVGMDGEFRPYFWGNDPAWLNQRVCVFANKRPKGKVFLYYSIKPLLYAIEQTQMATTVIHIGKKDFDSFEISLPNEEVLNQFDDTTAPLLNRIIANSYENKRLEQLRDLLLPKLMSGEIDVSSVEI
jgi:type I restriction enzyme S subunit